MNLSPKPPAPVERPSHLPATLDLDSLQPLVPGSCGMVNAFTFHTFKPMEARPVEGVDYDAFEISEAWCGAGPLWKHGAAISDRWWPARDLLVSPWPMANVAQRGISIQFRVRNKSAAPAAFKLRLCGLSLALDAQVACEGESGAKTTLPFMPLAIAGKEASPRSALLVTHPVERRLELSELYLNTQDQWMQRVLQPELLPARSQVRVEGTTEMVVVFGVVPA